MTDLVLSVFSGADLFGLAFHQEGFCVVAGPELLFGRDGRGWHVPAGRFDGVLGSPPCQMFSPLVHLIRATGHEPRHSNLIPEFERVVAEAEPRWFLMEEVPQAPVPSVAGYAVHDFILDNCTLDRGDGFGLAQMRERRFSFGVRGGGQAVDLRRWIAFAALELPNGHRDADRPSQHSKEHTVRSRWETVKARTVIARKLAASASQDGRVARWLRAGANQKAPPSARGFVRSWSECCALQGMPEDWLMERNSKGELVSPLFTKTGRFMLLGNGVSMHVGRALARAVRAWRESHDGLGRVE